MKRVFVLLLVLMSTLAGTTQGAAEGPEKWGKIWDRNFQLRIGDYNPKNWSDHHTWKWSSQDQVVKYAVDLLPLDNWDRTTPIKVYSPVDGRIECMNLFDAEPEGSMSGTSCKRGHSSSDKNGKNNPY